MVLARRFLLYFLALLCASSCRAQYAQQGYNQHPYNQQQSYGQHPGNQQYQQQQYQQQYRPNNGFGAQQMAPGGAQQQHLNANPVAVKPKTGVVNKPQRTVNANSNLNRTAPLNANALVTVSLVSYSNPKFLVSSDNLTCATKDVSNCKISFSIILSAKDQSAAFISTDLFPFPNGTLSPGKWNSLSNLTMTSKPQSIDVIIHHHGAVLNARDFQTVHFEKMIEVDTFVAVLTDYTPSAAGSQPQVRNVRLNGHLVNSTLGIAYSVQCAGNAKGVDCDLFCGSPVASSSKVICRNAANQAYSCDMASPQQQADSCILCYNGADNSTNLCRSERSQAPNPGVSPAFRTWTIVLGCLLGIAVIFIILLMVFYVIVRNQNENSPARRTLPYQPPPTRTPLLRDTKDDEWDHARPPAGLGRTGTTNTNPISDISRSSDQSDVRGNGMTSPRREVAV